MRIQSYHKGILFASEWSHRRAPIPMFFGVLLAALVILDLASHRPDVFFFVELQQFHSNGGKDRKGVNKCAHFFWVPYFCANIHSGSYVG